MARGPGGFSVGRVSIQVVPDTSKFREELLTKLKKEVKGIKVEIPVDLDAAKAVTQLKALDSILKKIDGRKLNIAANVTANRDLDKVSNDLSKVGKSANDAASGFSSLGRTGLIVLGVVVLLAPALALVATLLAGLPSLLFAFGAGAAAIALGFDGLKKAAGGFSPTVERLKKSLSGTFEKQLTKPFQELNKLAPVLDKGLNAIAVSISTIVTDMIRFVTSVDGMQKLNTILEGTARFFNLLSPAITTGLNALFTLAAEASKEFDGLAATLNRFAKGFLAVVQVAASDGTLGSALRNLNVVLDALLEAFNQFFAAGLKAMTVLGGPLAILLDGFADAFVALMPILTAVSKLTFEVFGEAFKQLTPILRALSPAIETLGKLLGTILVGALRALGPLLTIVATIINDIWLRAMSAISPMIGPFIDFLTQLATLIGQFLVTAFQSLSPFLTIFVRFIQDLMIALTPLLPMLIDFATNVLMTMAQVFQQIGPELVTLGEQLFPQLLQVVKDLVPIFGDFLKAVIPLLPLITELAVIVLGLVIPVMQGLLQTISEVWPSIRQIIQGAIMVITGIINVFVGLITLDWERVWKGLGQILKGHWELFKGIVKAGITAILDFFIGLPQRILSSLLGLPASMAASGRAMMQGLIDGIVSRGKAVVDAALGVVERVRGLLPFSPAKEGPFSGKGYTLYSGRALMEDWARGITEATPTAVRAVEEAMAATQNGMDIAAEVTSEGFGGIGAQVAAAIEGMEIKADGTNIARVVNKANNLNARR